MPNLKLEGLAFHIGSQLTSLAPFIEAMSSLRDLYLELKASQIALQHLNVGGGLGVRYRDETPPSRAAYVEAVKAIFAPTGLKLVLEPGRSIVAEAGLLLTRVEYLKASANKHFAVVDAAMNDYLRPALYDAWQAIVPLRERGTAATHYDIVGPVCESADFLGRDRALALEPGDYLAILTTGAYGFSMSSNYNSRARPAEILVDGDQLRVIRPRERLEALFAAEK